MYKRQVITADHKYVDYEMIAKYSPLVYDTRNVYEGNKSENIFTLGGGKRDCWFIRQIYFKRLSDINIPIIKVEFCI